jgi:hypothetical protein
MELFRFSVFQAIIVKHQARFELHLEHKISYCALKALGFSNFSFVAQS